MGAKSDFAIDDVSFAPAGSQNPPSQVLANGASLIGSINTLNNVSGIGGAGGAAIGGAITHGVQGAAGALPDAIDAGVDSFYGGNENLGAGGSPTDPMMSVLTSLATNVNPGQGFIVYIHVKWKECNDHWCCWPFFSKMTKDDGFGKWFRYPPHDQEGFLNTPELRVQAVREGAQWALQQAAHRD